MDKKYRYPISQSRVINHESLSGQVKLYKSYLHDMALVPVFLQERKSFIRVPQLSLIPPNPSDFDRTAFKALPTVSMCHTSWGEKKIPLRDLTLRG